MPDYKVLPVPGEVSIEEALAAGKKDIVYPSRIIIAGGFALGILLPVCGLSLWWLLIVPVIGLIVAYIFVQVKTPWWRIWAYAGVKDIHQFQRSAELDLLLPRRSPMEPFGIMEAEQSAMLAQLQQRFLEDTPFIDDPNIPLVSKIFDSGIHLFSDKATPRIVIGDEGIAVRPQGFYPWAAIQYEGVITISYTGGKNVGDSNSTASGSKCFRFYAPDEIVEISMDDLAISPAELDLVLYVHRGRYALKAGA